MVSPLKLFVSFLASAGASFSPFALYNLKQPIGSTEGNKSQDFVVDSSRKEELKNLIIDNISETQYSNSLKSNYQSEIHKEELIQNNIKVNFSRIILNNCSLVIFPSTSLPSLGKISIPWNNNNWYLFLNCFDSRPDAYLGKFRSIFLLDKSSFHALEHLNFRDNIDNQRKEISIVKKGEKTYLSVQNIQNNKFISTILFTEIERVVNRMRKVEVYKITKA